MDDEEIGMFQEHFVCYNAFLSIDGITVGRVKNIKYSLAQNGVPTQDKRGRHGHRPHKFTHEVHDSIIQHISSLHARKSYYSSGQKQKLRVYLHEGLNTTLDLWVN